MLRPEEEFVLKHLGSHLNALTEPGEDPPDGYVLLDGRRIPVEITKLTAISFTAAGKPKNRLAEDMFGANMVNTIDAEIGSLVNMA
jgi:hypothetical protein